MNRDFKKENRGKKNRSDLLEPLINQRKVIVDHPQEEEEEVMDVEDSPKMIKLKKIDNHLTSQILSAIIFRRWVISHTYVIQVRRRMTKKKR